MLLARFTARAWALIALWCGTAALIVTAFSADWLSVWRAVGVPSMFPAFADLRTITGGLKSMALGFDPLTVNPGDPWQRPMNYPRVWLALFSELGIDDSNVAIVGVAFAIVFLLCISRLVLNARSRFEAWCLGLSALSIAGTFAIERGNSDLLMFALVFVGLVTRATVVAVLLMAVAAALKLFPVMGFVGLLPHTSDRRRVVRPLLVAVSATALVLGFQMADLEAIREHTPRSAAWSYGTLAVEAAVLKVAVMAGLGDAAQQIVSSISVGLIWIAAILVVLTSWRRTPRLTSATANDRNADLFLGFGTIYAATFMLGSNWTYRLIFLIPTLPFALGLRQHDEWKRAGALYAGLWLAVLNVDLFGRYLLPLGHVLKTAMTFAVLMGLVLILKSRFSTPQRNTVEPLGNADPESALLRSNVAASDDKFVSGRFLSRFLRGRGRERGLL